MKKSTKRNYESPRRRAQAEATRERILEAFANQLGQPDLVEFSIEDVACQAGVSARTVYYHFPNREYQLEALADWLDRKIVGNYPEPSNPNELLGLTRHLYARFAEREMLIRAQHAPGLGRVVRRLRRSQRIESIFNALAQIQNLQPKQLSWASALVAHLLSADTGIALKDEYGMEPEEAGQAVAWLLEVFLAELGELPPR